MIKKLLVVSAVLALALSACRSEVPGNPVCGNATAGANEASCRTECAGRTTDLTTDVQHCGACGNECSSRPFARAACIEAQCGLACDPGRLDCDSNTATGCEVDSARDPLNCGACGVVCPPREHASGVCRQGSCALLCEGRFLDCNGEARDGCEVDGSLDSRNCGNCGEVCTPSPHANVACVAGSCLFTSCVAPYLSCGSGPVANCDTNGMTDHDHCGSCGVTCRTSERCEGGKCVLDL